MNNLASFYFQRNERSRKELSLKIILSIKQVESNPIFIATTIKILLWNEKIKEAQKLLEVFLNKYMKEDDAALAISRSLTDFLIFKQKQILYKLFKEHNAALVDRFKPVYFALLNEMKAELPNEYLKMPEELEEPVNDLLSFVKLERERLEIG